MGRPRLEGRIDGQLQRRHPVGAGNARRYELIERRRCGARVAGREVGVVAGPGVDPAPVVAVAARVELRRREREPVEGEDAAAVREERRQRLAERRCVEPGQVELPRLRLRPAPGAHLPRLVRPAVAVADEDQPARRRRLRGPRGERAARKRRPERAETADPERLPPRDHGESSAPPPAAFVRNSSLPAIAISRFLIESSARKRACSSPMPETSSPT